ncbi:MAG: hypothetical protein AB1705_20230 [Verrucomicrobiota bacterium]
MASELPPDAFERIRAAIVSGNKIEAIRLLREARPDLGLAEAKQFVERWEAGEPVGLPDETLRGPDPAIEELLYRGQKITAIKAHREKYRSGLADAKNAVEVLEAELRAKHPERFSHAPKSGCAGVFLLLLTAGMVTWWRA